MAGKAQVVGGSTVARATIEATVIRKDGTIEHLGIIADSGLLNERLGFFQRMRAALWPKH